MMVCLFGYVCFGGSMSVSIHSYRVRLRVYAHSNNIKSISQAYIWLLYRNEQSSIQIAVYRVNCLRAWLEEILYAFIGRRLHIGDTKTKQRIKLRKNERRRSKRYVILWGDENHIWRVWQGVVTSCKPCRPLRYYHFKRYFRSFLFTR